MQQLGEHTHLSVYSPGPLLRPSRRAGPGGGRHLEEGSAEGVREAAGGGGDDAEEAREGGGAGEVGLDDAVALREEQQQARHPVRLGEGGGKRV